VVRHPAHDVVGHLHAFFAPRVEQKAGERGAAVSRDVVVAAQAGAQHGGDLAEDQVA
jgi:hypothetical protein